MTPLDFLKLLWQDGLLGLFLLVWTLDDKRSRWFTDVAAAAQYADSCHGRDVYVGYGLALADHGPARRRPSEEIAAVCGAWADLDLASDAHNNKPLPRTAEEAIWIIPSDLQPTVVLHTGNGLQAWWLFREPEVFENAEHRMRVTTVLKRLHTLLRLRASHRGWAYDRLDDLARVVRMPGTVNAKDKQHLKDVRVWSHSDCRYNLGDLEEYLDEAGIPSDVEPDRAIREWVGNDNTNLAINFDAAISQEVLDGWMAEDPRFRKTWLRQRDDLKDQSQSGYDLALANFGVDANLNEQQIIDLIVQHRRMHAERPRRRLDYYTRTVRAAMNRSGGIEPVPVTVPADGADPEAAKALLCDHISKTLNVPILRLVKITGQDPTYHMHLADGSIVEFPSFAKFTAFESVRNAIGAVTNKLVPKIKPKAWEEVAQAMLDALIEKPGGDDTDMLASTRMLVCRYLSEIGFIEAIEGHPAHAQRRPAVIDGSVAISASDFQMYINKTSGQSLSVKAVTSRLAALGAESVRHRSGPFRDQSRWMLPAADFPPGVHCEWLRQEDRDADGE